MQKGEKHLKLRIYNEISYEKLCKIAPQRYRAYVSSIPSDGTFDVAMFPGDEVILSGTARKAIRRIEHIEGRRKVVIGYCFTLESKKELAESGFEIVEFHSFSWTDESYVSIRQGTY
jgi:hypothetical protein